MMPKNISVFFPAYNEAQNLVALIAEADAMLKENFAEYEIIIVNDGSTDDSAIILENLCRLYPSLRIITHQTNSGYGAAIKSGLLASKNDLIFFSDADRQFDLKELKLLVGKLNGYDAVIGYRWQRHDNSARILVGWAWNKSMRLIFGFSYKDVDCAFKLFKKESIEKINIKELKSTGAMVSTELLVKLKKYGTKIAEIPVSHFPRKQGHATGGNLKVIARAFHELYKLWKTLRGRKIR